MKTRLVNIPPQNLQLQHKMHHKLGHQQTTTLLEFQLGLLVQDQIHIVDNHTQVHLHDVSLLSTVPLIQMMKYKMKLKILPHSVILLLMFRHLQELFSILHKIQILHKI